MILMKKIILSIIIFMGALLLTTTNIQNINVNVLANDEVMVSLYQDDVLDIVLTKGETDTNLNNFKADLETELVSRDVPLDNINIQAFETTTVSTNESDASQIFNSWKRYNDYSDWHYDENNKTISKTTNSMWSGFYDPNFDSNNFSLELTMFTDDPNSTWTDDDDLGFTFGMHDFTTELNDNQTGYAFIFAGSIRDYSSNSDHYSQMEVHGHPTGLYKINGKNLTLLVDKREVIYDRYDSKKYSFKLVVSGNKINIYQKSEQSDYGEPIISYEAADEIGGNWGFFANSQPYSYFTNVMMQSTNEKRFSDVIRQPQWQYESLRFIVNAHDGKVDDFSNEVSLGEILTRLGNEDISYIGWGYDASDGNSLISKNDNDGIYIDKNNDAYNSYEKQIDGIADYIYNIYFHTIDSNAEYLIYGKDNRIDIKPSILQSNTIDEQWPNGKWMVKHDSTYFDNSTGNVLYSNQYLDSIDLNFRETGKYEVYYMDNLLKTVYVHRNPIANFTVDVDVNNNITLTDQSYDPDYQISDPKRGIKEKIYSYREVNSLDWIDGLPTTIETNKNYIIRQVVKDLNDCLSIPYYNFVSTTANENLKPISEFTVTPVDLLKYNDQTILKYNDTSYDPTNLAIAERSWTVSSGEEIVYSGSTALADFKDYAPGVYKITLKVKNSNGIWSEETSRFITVIDDKTKPTYTNTISVNKYYKPIEGVISFKDEDNGSGFSHRFVVVTNSATKPDDFGSLSTNKNFIYNFANLGEYYIHFQAYDYAGNLTEGCIGPYIIEDKNAPTNPDITLSNGYEFDTWSNQAVEINFTGSTDDFTSMENLKYSYQINEGTAVSGNTITLEESGIYKLKLIVTDESNQSNVISKEVKIDKNKPTSAKINLVANNNPYISDTWSDYAVQATLAEASDETSSIAKYEYQINDGEWIEGRSYTFAQVGIYTIKSRVYDEANNVSSTEEAKVKVDFKQPTNPAITTSNDYEFDTWSNQAVEISFTDSTDDFTSKENLKYSYQINDESVVSGNSINLLKSGEYELKLIVTDESNKTNVTSKKVKIDLEKPSMPTIAASNDYEFNTWTNQGVQLTFKDSIDKLSQIDHYEYKINTGDWKSGIEYEVNTSGVYTVIARAIDKARNISDPVGKIVKIDLDKPTTPTIATSNDYEFNTWTNQDVQLTFKDSTDALSKLAYYEYKVDNGAWQKGNTCTLNDSKEYKILVRAIDQANNSSDEIEKVIKIDKNKPTSAKINLVANNNPYISDTWSDYAVQATLAEASDETSSIAKYEYQINDGEWIEGRSYTFAKVGIYTIKSRVYDEANNVSSTEEAKVKVDFKQPTNPTITTSNDYEFDTWTNQAVEISFTDSTDDFTSKENLKYSYQINDETVVSGNSINLVKSGEYELKLIVTDESNKSNVTSKKVKIDLEKPTTPTIATSNDYEFNTWINQDVQLTFKDSTDNLSEVDHYEYKINTGEWKSGIEYEVNTSGIYTVIARAIDKAGNISDPVGKIVKIDLEKPNPFEIKIINDTIGQLTIMAQTTDDLSSFNNQSYRLFDGTNWSVWKADINDTIYGYQRDEVKNIIVEAKDLAGNIQHIEKEVRTKGNTAPIAIDDYFATKEDSKKFKIAVLTNDQDDDFSSTLNDTLKIIKVSKLSDASSGKITFDNNYVYFELASNYYGTFTFNYTINDEYSAESTAQVTVFVKGLNDQPQINNDSYTINEGESITFNPLANDYDFDSELSVTSIDQPSNGTISQNGNEFTYKPNANFIGVEILSYTVTDQEYVNQGTITIEVKGSKKKPILQNDSYKVMSGEEITFNPLTNDQSSSATKLQITKISKPQHGEALIVNNQIKYKAFDDYVGQDNFTYTINDGEYTVSANITITIEQKDSISKQLKVAEIEVLEVSEITLDSQPEYANIQIVNNEIVYELKDNVSGIDHFTFIKNGKKYQLIANVKEDQTVDIIGYGLPISSDEISNDQENYYFKIKDLQKENVKNIQINTKPLHGEIIIEGNEIKYIPNDNYEGSDYILVSAEINGETVIYSAVFDVLKTSDTSLIDINYILIILSILYLSMIILFKKYYHFNKKKIMLHLILGFIAIIMYIILDNYLNTNIANVLFMIFIVLDFAYLFLVNKQMKLN